jgi:acylphosphatase
MTMVSYVHVFFSGRVQGVGFRYQTLQVAKGYDVAGYVRNLDDGRVEMEAEGEADELDRFVDAVRECMDGYIKGAEIASGLREGSLSGFAIRR